ncbi:hypothetical protein MMC30_003887 [Trapelia coarctata]|nr:hypothetical protein [Trapelia coarctata]
MNSAYKPPPGGLYVPNPRTISDIVFRSLAIHAFSICAYTHLASLLPLNTISRVVALQVVLFTVFPEFVLVQLLSYGIVALYAIIILYLYPKTTDPTTSNVEESRDALPVSRANSPDQIEASAASSPSLALRLLIIALYCLPLVATVFAYKQRLGIKYLAATYVGNLKIDHRNGWIAIGGLVAAGMTLVILFTKHFYLKQAKTDERMRSIKVPLSVILLQMGATVSVHQFLLEATNHPTLISQTFTWPTLFLVMTLGLVGLRYPIWRPALYAAVASFVVAATALSQFRSDFQELVGVSNNRAQPYNYRWKVKDLVSASSSAF